MKEEERNGDKRQGVCLAFFGSYTFWFHWARITLTTFCLEALEVLGRNFLRCYERPGELTKAGSADALKPLTQCWSYIISFNIVDNMAFVADTARRPDHTHVLLITTGSVASIKAPLIVKELLSVSPTYVSKHSGFVYDFPSRSACECACRSRGQQAFS